MSVTDRQQDRGSAPPERRTFVLRALALVFALFLVVAGIGQLLTKVLNKTAPIKNEDSLDRSLAAGRTPSGNTITKALSTLASTPVIIGILLLMIIVFRLVYHRWRESAFLFFAVWTQSLVFVAVAAVTKRARPKDMLDSAPPTSSFPSGHTGAAVSLFVGIALVVAWRTRHAWLRPLMIALAIAVPLAVAYSRLYRGMHHPSDVLAAMVNGLLAVTIWARSLLFGILPERWARALDGGRHSEVTARGDKTGVRA